MTTALRCTRRLRWLLSLTALVAVPASAAPPELRPVPSRSGDTWIGNAVCYGAHRDGQRPGGPAPSRDEIAADLDILQRQWHLLRMYAADDVAATVLDLIRTRKLDMRVMLGVWIDPEHDATSSDGAPHVNAAAQAANQQQVARAIALANQYHDTVAAISVGNETQVDWSSHRVDPAVLVQYIRAVRSQTRVPVTSADDFTFWLEPRSQPIAAELDFICTHIHPLWRSVQLPDAVAYTQREFAAVQAAFPQQPVVIGEVGWATTKHTEGDQAKYMHGAVGELEQKEFYDALLAWTTHDQVVNFFFEAFDENWKGGPHPDEVEKHWGLYNADRTPKLAARGRLGIVTDAWRARVCRSAWICYTPTQSDPAQRVYPAASELRTDLKTLRDAGFTGLITYGCKLPVLRELPALAEETGFTGLILGIWDPLDEEECAAACALARRDIVVGLCAGNEGLGSRYSYEELVRAMDRLRTATGKPIATTEEIGDYLEPRVLTLGDWVFPNVHPVYQGRNTLMPGIRWTIGAYRDLCRRADRFVWLKETGWPSAGGEAFTPEAQQQFYIDLAAANVAFGYFEAFDQPWKHWRACEPHFGLFDAQRQPKPLVAALQPDGPVTLRCGQSAATTQPATTNDAPTARLYVYRDADAPENHFTPTGRQGDEGDVHVNEAWREDVYAGETCLRLELAAKGEGPHGCDYGPPCRWAGLRWLEPAHNWGRSAEHADAGLDLHEYRRVVFQARAAAPCTVSFLVGGIDTAYGDSLAFPAQAIYRLDEQWHRYTIDLTGSDLHRIIAGFGCVSTWESNPAGVVVYLDEIYFE